QTHDEALRARHVFSRGMNGGQPWSLRQCAGAVKFVLVRFRREMDLGTRLTTKARRSRRRTKKKIRATDTETQSWRRVVRLAAVPSGPPVPPCLSGKTRRRGLISSPASPRRRAAPAAARSSFRLQAH